MNHIYKVIWSKVKNRYVVVSELAKSQGKSSQTKAVKVAATAMLAACVLSTTSVSVANTIVDDGAGTGKNTIAPHSSVTLVGKGNAVQSTDNNEIFGNSNRVLNTTSDLGTTQNIGIFGSLNKATNSDILYITGYENTAEIQFHSLLQGWNNNTTAQSSGVLIGTTNHVKSNNTDWNPTHTLNQKYKLGINEDGFDMLYHAAPPNANIMSTLIGTGNEIEEVNLSSTLGNFNVVKNSDLINAFGSNLSIDKATNAFIAGNKSSVKNSTNTIALGNHIELDGLKDAVSIGESSKVTQSGGIALGSDSKATTAAGVYGVNSAGAAMTDKDILALAGKTEADLKPLNEAVTSKTTVYNEKKSDYEGKKTTYESIYKEALLSGGDMEAYAKAKGELQKAEQDMIAAEQALAKATSNRDKMLSAWKSTASALSIGDAEKGITRQITNVSAGTLDTDAVNVAQLKALDKKASATASHYYSVNDMDASLQILGNYNNDGAKGIGSMAAGLGSSVKVTSLFQGATANVFGILNTVDATGDKAHNGVANSIVGVANTTKDANAALIFGAGNLVKNAYSDLNFNPTTLALEARKGPEALTKALAKAVKDNGGDVLVIGGANEADWARYSSIIGVSNKITGTEEIPSLFSSAIGARNTIKNSDQAYVTGKENNITEGNTINVLGNTNTISYANRITAIGIANRAIGTKDDNVEDTIIIGNNRDVSTRGDHNVILGSSDTRTYNSSPNIVLIGHNANVQDHGGNTHGGGEVAIGHNAFIENYINQTGSIAIGQNSHVQNMTGSTEAAFVMNQYETKEENGITMATDVAKIAEGVAIGENSYARTGSLMIGTHKYTGEIGDTTVDTSNANSMREANLMTNSTTLGTNSFNHGAFTTVTGAYSIISGDYNAGKWRNMGATITGSLNSIESKTAQATDAGVGTHVLGMANRAFNTNGTLLIGSGNEVTNAIATINPPTKNNVSAKDTSLKLREALKTNHGGSVMAIGNANTADFVQNSRIIGSSNILKGAEGAISSDNTLIGDNRVVNGKSSHNIIIGSVDATNDENTLKDVNDSISIGHESKAKQNAAVALGKGSTVDIENGVALGALSVANRAHGSVGYDPAKEAHQDDATGTWKSTLAAVSVGDSSKNLTRQITSVAAGTENTDAVNVAQLKAVEKVAKAAQEAANSAKTTLTAGDNVTITPGTTANSYTISAKDTTLAAATNALSLDGKTLKLSVKDTSGKEVKGSVDLAAIVSGVADTRNTLVEGDHINLAQKTLADGSTQYTVNVVADGQVAKDNTGLVTGGTVFNETRVAADGTYVKKDKTAGENLSALDGQVASNTQNITNLGNQVTTNTNNINNLTENINSMSNQMNKLDSRMDRVGAGAAALAALRPLDFNAEEKWDVAAGYGNYAGANAVAIGAFYRPNENTMFSIGGSFGGGENMVNTGITFKFGKGPHSSHAKAAMVPEAYQAGPITSITAMQSEIKTLSEDNKALREQVKAQDEKIAKLMELFEKQGK